MGGSFFVCPHQKSMTENESLIDKQETSTETLQRIQTDEGRIEFKKKLKQKKEAYGRGRKRWSFAFHATLYLSALLGATAALLPRLEYFKDLFDKEKSYSGDVVSLLAFAGSVAITISTAGGFSRKWNASRTSKGRVEQIEIELIGRNPTLEDVKKLAQIEIDHDRAVLGG